MKAVFVVQEIQWDELKVHAIFSFPAAARKLCVQAQKIAHGQMQVAVHIQDAAAFVPAGNDSRWFVSRDSAATLSGNEWECCGVERRGAVLYARSADAAVELASALFELYDAAESELSSLDRSATTGEGEES